MSLKDEKWKRMPLPLYREWSNVPNHWKGTSPYITTVDTSDDFGEMWDQKGKLFVHFINNVIKARSFVIDSAVCDSFKIRVDQKLASSLLREYTYSCWDTFKLEPWIQEGRSRAVDQCLHEVLVAFDYSKIKHDLGTLIPDNDRSDYSLESLLKNTLCQVLDPLFPLVLSRCLRWHRGSVLLELLFHFWVLV